MKKSECAWMLQAQKEIILKKLEAHRKRYRGRDFMARIARSALKDAMDIVRGA